MWKILRSVLVQAAQPVEKTPVNILITLGGLLGIPGFTGAIAVSDEDGETFLISLFQHTATWVAFFAVLALLFFRAAFQLQKKMTTELEV